MSIKEQARAKNLYGKDVDIEQLLSKVESAANCALRVALSAGTEDLSPNDRIATTSFVSIQLQRTPAAIESLQVFHDRAARFAFKGNPSAEKALSHFRVEANEPHLILLKQAMEFIPVVADLRIEHIRNNSALPFVVGQQPAVVVNPFLHERRWPGPGNGLSLKGAVILFPVSPEDLVVLYDRHRYRVASWVRREGLDENDARTINLLQFCYSTDCIYFRNAQPKLDFEGWNTMTKEFREWNGPLLDEGRGAHDGKPGRFLRLTFPKPPIPPIFDFLGVKQFALHEGLGETLWDMSRDEIKPVLSAMYERDRKGGRPSENAQG